MSVAEAIVAAVGILVGGGLLALLMWLSAGK